MALQGFRIRKLCGHDSDAEMTSTVSSACMTGVAMTVISDLERERLKRGFEARSNARDPLLAHGKSSAANCVNVICAKPNTIALPRRVSDFSQS